MIGLKVIFSRSPSPSLVTWSEVAGERCKSHQTFLAFDLIKGKVHIVHVSHIPTMCHTLCVRHHKKHKWPTGRLSRCRKMPPATHSWLSWSTQCINQQFYPLPVLPIYSNMGQALRQLHALHLPIDTKLFLMEMLFSKSHTHKPWGARFCPPNPAA